MVPLLAAGLAVPQSAALAAPRAATPAGAAATAIHRVTLVTGDVVTVRTLAGGEQTAEVDRPDNATGGVRIQKNGGDLFVLPDEALPLLSGDKLDRRLFNVTDLIEMGYDDAKAAAVPSSPGTCPAARVRPARSPRGAASWSGRWPASGAPR
ncbi:hypothetical protein Phou_050540 [Phytohabitans houttuyneae]|uniref:DUF5666 domain-containing protein n=1 Tax=Phytohabitans houttuyneae TaxID=1076126 RepID=A0A6V8KAT4_9ACTN|nr:hypothetical protein Phou_050540 [Phytohabitans houttuyneae]